MPQRPAQSYANHVKKPWLFLAQVIGYVASAAIALLGLCFPGSTMGVCLIGTGLLLMAVINVSLTIKTRIYALTVQDRVIRLEMQLRLERVLPDDIKEAARGLSLRQLIALRFASDAELPELVRKVAEGSIASGSDIKQQVKDWQADHHRV